MSGGSRVRFNPETGELEVEGSEAFVREMLDRLGPAAGQIVPARPHAGRVKESKSKKPKPTAKAAPADEPDESSVGFGEFLHQFPSELREQDSALIAGSFIEDNSGDDEFRTATVNKLLQDHGIKLSNASLAVKRNKTAKYIFMTKKGCFRVSKAGRGQLENLRSKGS